MNPGRTYALLVTLDAGYLKQLAVMLKSILNVESRVNLDVYILHKKLRPEHFDKVLFAIGGARVRFLPIQIDDDSLSGAPTTKRYPLEMYYRLLASRYLPIDLDRVLYLDPDVVVIHPLAELYDYPLGELAFVGCSHVTRGMRNLNAIRLGMSRTAPYINSGILLMNLRVLRRIVDPKMIFDFIRKNKAVLALPDQDVLSALYGDRSVLVDSLRFNLSDRYLRLANLRRSFKEPKLDLEWVKKHGVIIHYCGRNKPWKPDYVGELDVFWNETVKTVDFSAWEV
ncbi:MAG: glycosyltransferase family 8 protein [Bacillota bacterium]|nr:glycosyltransferase family 8 protein [Bacillota bacterium]